MTLGLVRVRVIVKVRVKVRFRVQKYLGFDPFRSFRAVYMGDIPKLECRAVGAVLF